MTDAFTVGWTAMSEGTTDDYVRLDRLYRDHTDGELVGNLLAMFRLLEGPTLGYRIDRARHSRQSATRALRNGEPTEVVVASPYYDRCVDFCASYDQDCFDPHHDDLPLADFVPLVEEILSHPVRQYQP